MVLKKCKRGGGSIKRSPYSEEFVLVYIQTNVRNGVLLKYERGDGYAQMFTILLGGEGS